MLTQFPPEADCYSTPSPSDRINRVTYTFTPRYPVLGDTQEAVGISSANREVRLSLRVLSPG